MVEFLASSAGRIIRIVAGIAIILIGYFWIPAPWKYVFEAVGLVPLAAGIFDFCVLAPLMGKPFWGREIRGDAR
jgi:hypothetical protein